MRHFEPVLTASHPTTQVAPPAPAPVAVEPVVETVAVTPRPSEARGFIGKADDAWSWSDLRDYVVHEIEVRFGPQPRDAKKEYGIFNRFLNAWGAQAPAIARTAFEVHDGFWKGAPISVNRFTKNSDPYFASEIAARLTAPPQYV